MMQRATTTGLKAAIASLNPAQRAAVLAPERPTLVLAGAGSGKTRVLTTRIAYLIANGVPPSHILAITFTNKAAREMRERLDVLIGPEAGNEVMARTFHSFGLWVLRVYAGSKAGILDDSDQLYLIRQILQDARLADAPGEVLNALALIKDCLWDQDAAIKASVSTLDWTTMVSVIKTYATALEQNNLLDFGDLLLKPVQLLQTYQDIRQRLRARFEYVLADEWQDVNPTQNELVRLLCAPARPVFVVGDDDQSIYSWRGANPEVLFQFEKDYLDTQIFRLEQNYRSTQVILEAANELIQHNRRRHEKRLYTLKKDGYERIRLFQASSGEEEAGRVAMEIRQCLDDGVSPKDMAVLYRTNAQSRVLEEVLRVRNVPYTIIGGVGFYRRAEIQDFLAHLNFIANPLNGRALRRLAGAPPKGIGEKTLARLDTLRDARGLDYLELMRTLTDEDAPLVGGRHILPKLTALATMLDRIASIFASPDLALSAKARKALEQTGLLPYYERCSDGTGRDRRENLEEFVSLVAGLERVSGAETLQDLLDHVSLMTDQDNLSKEDRDTVTLMTLHKAKGLEFRFVWITGCEDEFLPHIKSREPAEVEEERRLLYVGITRAKERLTLSHADCRTMHGDELFRYPSPFLAEIPQELLETVRREPTAEPGNRGDLANILWM